MDSDCLTLLKLIFTDDVGKFFATDKEAAVTSVGEHVFEVFLLDFLLTVGVAYCDVAGAFVKCHREERSLFSEYYNGLLFTDDSIEIYLEFLKIRAIWSYP